MVSVEVEVDGSLIPKKEGTLLIALNVVLIYHLDPLLSEEGGPLLLVQDDHLVGRARLLQRFQSDRKHSQIMRLSTDMSKNIMSTVARDWLTKIKENKN